MENETEWVAVPDYNGLIEVTRTGLVRIGKRIRNYERTGIACRMVLPARKLEPIVTKFGYAEVGFSDGGKWCRERVHRLVAKAFVPGEFADAEIDHLDGDKLNNCPENLEWVTKSENVSRAWKHGLNKGARPKLDQLKEDAVWFLYQNNFPPKALGEWFGISTSLAYQIGRGTLRQRPSSRGSAASPR